MRPSRANKLRRLPSAYASNQVTRRGPPLGEKKLETGARQAAGLLGILPAAWLEWLYELVARHRYRIFGRYAHCLTPRPEYRNRFLDP